MSTTGAPPGIPGGGLVPEFSQTEENAASNGTLFFRETIDEHRFGRLRNRAANTAGGGIATQGHHTAAPPVPGLQQGMRQPCPFVADGERVVAAARQIDDLATGTDQVLVKAMEHGGNLVRVH